MIVELALAKLPDLDESTQVRVAIDDAIVADYADLMQAGAVFPPVTAFREDDARLYLADGYHRVRAARRAGLSTMLVDLQTGTQADALWYALGANRAHGQRLSSGDKTRAVTLALAQWPTRGVTEIAAQVGCATSLVQKIVARSATGGAAALRGRALANQQKRDAVRAMVQDGHQSIAIHRALGANTEMIAAVRRELGLSTIDYSRSGVRARRDQVRALAASGHTSPQIAAELGITVQGCRKLCRQIGLVIPGDTVMRRLHHHDSNRIMARIVADAEDLAAGADLIDFRALNRAQCADWIATLQDARRTLGMFIKRLTQEQTHGEVPESPAVEDPSRAGSSDAGAARLGGAAYVPSGARRQDRGGDGSQQVGVPDRQLA